MRILISNDGIESVGLKTVERGPFAFRDGAEAGSRIEPSEQRINPKPKFQLPRPASCVAIDRNKEWLELDEFRGDSQMYGAFAQTLAHQRELAGFEIAQAAVNQFAGSTGRTAGEAEAFDEQGAVTRGRGGLQYPGSVNAAADDDYIVLFHCPTLTRNCARMREYA